jgi:hypothetical protein
VETNVTIEIDSDDIWCDIEGQVHDAAREVAEEVVEEAVSEQVDEKVGDIVRDNNLMTADQIEVFVKSLLLEAVGNILGPWGLVIMPKPENEQPVAAGQESANRD